MSDSNISPPAWTHVLTAAGDSSEVKPQFRVANVGVSMPILSGFTPNLSVKSAVLSVNFSQHLSASSYFARLSPMQRVGYMWRNRPRDLVIFAVGLFGGI